jgi:hypothetical protein
VAVSFIVGHRNRPTIAVLSGEQSPPIGHRLIGDCRENTLAALRIGQNLRIAHAIGIQHVHCFVPFRLFDLEILYPIHRQSQRLFPLTLLSLSANVTHPNQRILRLPRTPSDQGDRRSLRCKPR